MDTLPLHERVVLLASRERKGALAWRNCVLGGACLAALLLQAE